MPLAPILWAGPRVKAQNIDALKRHFLVTVRSPATADVGSSHDVTGVERADFFQRRFSEGINNCPARTSSL